MLEKWKMKAMMEQGRVLMQKKKMKKMLEIVRREIEKMKGIWIVRMLLSSVKR